MENQVTEDKSKILIEAEMSKLNGDKCGKSKEIEDNVGLDEDKVFKKQIRIHTADNAHIRDKETTVNRHSLKRRPKRKDTPFSAAPKLPLPLLMDDETSPLKENSDEDEGSSEQSRKLCSWKQNPATVDEVNKLVEEWRAFCPPTPDSDITLDKYRSLFQQWKFRRSPRPLRRKISDQGCDEVDGVSGGSGSGSGGGLCDWKDDPKLTEEVNKVIQEWREYCRSTSRSEFDIEKYKGLLKQWKGRIALVQGIE